MKKSNAIFLYLGMVLIGIVLIYTFTRPYWLFWLSSSEANIGNAINGITAPFIALLGAILVYISFIEQVKANKSLAKQNSFNMTLNLITELKHDVQAGYSRGAKKSIATYIISIEKKDRINASTARHFNYILRSYIHIINRVEKIDLEEDDKDVLKLSLINIYDTYLDKHCERLINPALPSSTSHFKNSTIKSGKELVEKILEMKNG
jgi:hypothetical protein